MFACLVALALSERAHGAPRLWLNTGGIPVRPDYGPVAFAQTLEFIIDAESLPGAHMAARTYESAPTLRSAARFTDERSIKHVRLSTLLYKTLADVGSPRVLAVACWSSDDWGPVLSSADVGLPHAGGRSLLGFWLARQPRWLHVSPQVCRDAQALIDSKKANGRRAGALSSIIHEAMHSIGIPDEAKANCYAVQLVPVFVKNLGMSAHDSRNLGRLALLYVRRHAPPGYWDHYHCRDLGGWDLAPDANNLSS